MPPPPTVHIRLSGPGTLPCNGSTSSGSAGGPCIVTLQITNLTFAGINTEGEEKPQDDEGAMRFIIAVLLVYSLMGTAGMLILRIRQSATKANKKGAMKEANRYLKYRDKLSAECQKAKLVKETNRVLNKMRTLEWQKSYAESLTPSSPEGSVEDQAPLLLTQPHVNQRSFSEAHKQGPLPPISESIGGQFDTTNNSEDPLHSPGPSACLSDSSSDYPCEQLTPQSPFPPVSTTYCTSNISLLPANLVDMITPAFLSSLASEDCLRPCHIKHDDEMSKRASYNNIECKDSVDSSRMKSVEQETENLAQDQNGNKETTVPNRSVKLHASKDSTARSQRLIANERNSSKTSLNGTLSSVHSEI